MLFVIEKTSDYEYSELKEMNSLEELSSFIDENGGMVVIRDSYDRNESEVKVLEIYDTYRE